MKKYLAEMFGTMVLVLIGCGVAVSLGCSSVNPARSIAPALFAGGSALQHLWIFIVGPFVGACCAAGIWKVIETKN